jgi:thioredoxin 1
MIEINDKEFSKEVIKSTKPVLVMFWGSWCPVCKQAEPLLKKIAEEIDDIKVIKMNVDRNPHTVIKYEVMGTPNFCIFKNGKLVKQEFGSHSKKQILDMITNI